MLWVFDGRFGGYIDITGRDFGLETGDLIEVRAQTLPRKNEIDLSQTEIDVLFPSILPTPPLLSTSQLREDSFNNRFVKLRGWIRSVEKSDDRHFKLEMMMDTEMVEVVIAAHPDDRLPILKETLIEIDGVLTNWEASLDPNKNPGLLTSGTSHLQVLEKSIDSLFRVPKVSIEEVNSGTVADRVLLEGRVADFQMGKSVTIRDVSGEMRVPIWQTQTLNLDSVIQVSVQLEREKESMVPKEGVFRHYFTDRFGNQSSPWDIPIVRLGEVALLHSKEENKGTQNRILGLVVGIEEMQENMVYYLQDVTGTCTVVGPAGSRQLGFADWVELVIEFGSGTARDYPAMNKILRQSPGLIPSPVEISAGYLTWNRLQGQLVELLGIVTEYHQVAPSTAEILVEDPSGFIACRVIGATNVHQDLWLETLCRVKGVHRHSDQQLSLNSDQDLLVSIPDFVEVEQQRMKDPYNSPRSTIESLRNTDVHFGDRRVIQGTVTHIINIREFYLADESGAILVRNKNPESLKIGEGLLVSGFPFTSRGQDIFKLATTSPLKTPLPRLNSVELDDFQGVKEELIGLPVKLTARVIGWTSDSANTTMRLLSGDELLTVEVSPDLPEIKTGTEITTEVIYLATYDGSGEPIRQRFKLVEPQSVKIIKSPPLLKVIHVTFLALSIGIVALFFYFWNVSLRAKVRSQLSEIEQAKLLLEKRIEERTQELDLSDRALNSAINGAVITTAEGNQIIYCNHSVSNLFQWTKEELQNADMDLLFGPETDLSAVNQLKGAIRKCHECKVTLLCYRKDGSTLWNEISIAPVKNSKEQLTHFVWILLDVTESLEKEGSLRSAREEAENANKAKSQFLSRMSHELRTPLNSIIGFSKLLSMSSLPDKSLSNVHRIHKAGTHLLSLINDVLDISKIEASDFPITLKEVPLLQLLEEIIDLVRPMAGESNVKLQFQANTKPNLSVKADKRCLRQVFLNLASNGIKYNEDGGVLIIDYSKTDQNSVQICFRNSGEGIPSENLNRLFRPFDRLDAERSKVNIEGTGLGLALSKKMVEAMNGKIWATSTPGKTDFYVELSMAGNE